MRFFVSLALAIVFVTPTLDAQGIAWHTGYKNAVAEAQRLGKPLLLNFWAERCRGCQEMDESFWTRHDAIDLAARFVCVKVDIDRSGHLRRVYQADDLPAIVLTVSNDFYRRGLRTPDARDDPYLRAEILVAVGWNDLRLAG